MPSKALLHAAAIHALGGDYPWQRASDFRDWMIVRKQRDWPEVLASFFQALADPTRVRILVLLAEQPMTISHLVAALGRAQGRVSSHLTCLRLCGYVRAEVEGRFNRYTLIDNRIREIIRLGESIVVGNADRLTSCLVLASEVRP